MSEECVAINWVAGQVKTLQNEKTMNPFAEEMQNVQNLARGSSLISTRTGQNRVGRRKITKKKIYKIVRDRWTKSMKTWNVFVCLCSLYCNTQNSHNICAGHTHTYTKTQSRKHKQIKYMKRLWEKLCQSISAQKNASESEQSEKIIAQGRNWHKLHTLTTDSSKWKIVKIVRIHSSIPQQQRL